jgi:hypothetical protein
VPKAVAPKDDDSMDDVLADLDQARRNQSPASSPGASAKPASVVTQENVIIKGDKAEPVPGVDREVVHAQVLLHARRFLQPSVREALEKGRSLPEGGELSDGTFAREIGEIVERIIAETYHKKALPDGAEILADLWKAQREERGYLVRRGAPQRMIIEILNDYIREHASKVGSPFAGGVGASLIEEVERHAGENSFFEKGLPEIFRQICK